ncbi:MAG: Uma2 family endonuclease [Hormoscilla sp. SP12CHS1]|nr:Uma2 family endonuclease [Hormoscilla sp. SP12CHS1]
MVKISEKLDLPTSEELPCSDDTPVDNEEQNFIPNFLLFLLAFIWPERQDWFWGVDMAVYHTTGVSTLVPVVPDGFLSLGVERRKNNGSRTSYVVWEENDVVPILVLEVVSRNYGYSGLGVPYYVVHNPEYWRRDRQQPFVVYRLEDGEYVPQIGKPLWMPEIGLGIGLAIASIGGIRREVLCWYDQNGTRYQTAEELVERYRKRFGELPESDN